MITVMPTCDTYLLVHVCLELLMAASNILYIPSLLVFPISSSSLIYVILVLIYLYCVSSLLPKASYQEPPASHIVVLTQDTISCSLYAYGQS